MSLATRTNFTRVNVLIFLSPCQRGALADAVPVDSVRQVVQVDDAATEHGVESQHRKPAVVPHAHLQPALAEVALVEAVLERLLEDRARCPALSLGLALRVRQSPVRARPLSAFKNSKTVKMVMENFRSLNQRDRGARTIKLNYICNLIFCAII